MAQLSWLMNASILILNNCYPVPSCNLSNNPKLLQSRVDKEAILAYLSRLPCCHSLFLSLSPWSNRPAYLELVRVQQQEILDHAQIAKTPSSCLLKAPCRSKSLYSVFYLLLSSEGSPLIIRAF